MDTTSDKKKKLLVDLRGETYRRDHDEIVNKNHAIFIRALLNSSVFTEEEKKYMWRKNAPHILKMRAKL